MTIYYLDASAIAKRYLLEPGSWWINSLLDQTDEHRFVVVELGSVETVCAFTRARRTGRIGAAALARFVARASIEMKTILGLLAVSNAVLGYASQLALRYPLRAYDAVHLATALELRADSIAADLPAPIFVSADENLLAAARAEGLSAENPNDHP